MKIVIKKYWWIVVFIFLIFLILYLKINTSFLSEIFKKTSLKVLDNKEDELDKKIEKIESKNLDSEAKVEEISKEIKKIKSKKQDIKEKKFDDAKESYNYIMNEI